MRLQDMSMRQYYVLLFLGLVVLLIGLSFVTIMPSVLWVSFTIVFIICGVGVTTYWKKTGHDKTDDSNLSQVTVYIFAGLYGIIAGFAIKNVIESTISGVVDKITLSMGDAVSTQFSQVFMNLGQSTYEIAMLVVFLVTAIPFYHGAIMFLSKESRQKPEPPQEMLLHFGCLFIQAIIFLSISFVLHTLVLVIVLFIVLMLVDSIWIILSQRTLHKPPLGWLSTNLAFTMVLFLIIYSDWNLDFSAIILAIACVGRAFVDYIGFTDLYFPKKNQNLRT